METKTIVLELTKHQFELLASACLHKAASKYTTDEECEWLDEMSEMFECEAEEMEDEDDD